MTIQMRDDRVNIDRVPAARRVDMGAAVVVNVVV